MVEARKGYWECEQCIHRGYMAVELGECAVPPHLDAIRRRQRQARHGAVCYLHAIKPRSHALQGCTELPSVEHNSLHLFRK